MKNRTLYLAVSLLSGLALTVALVLLIGQAVLVKADPGVLYVAPGGHCNGVSPCYASVQAAVDAATSGDEICVASGVYTDVDVRQGITQVVFIEKTIAIRGGYTITNWTISDPSINITTLDAQGKGRVFYITGDITSTIEGLRITGGDASGLRGAEMSFSDGGGGLYAISATVMLSGCHIFYNRTPSDYALGGGGYLYQSDMVFENNVIEGNEVIHGVGGGLYLEKSYGILRQNVISGNHANERGGGVYLDQSDITVHNNRIEDNSVKYGGGLYLEQSNSSTISENTIASNYAHHFGGGIYLDHSSSAINMNQIVDNQSRYGGGVHLHHSAAGLAGNIIKGNRADNTGGGLRAYYSDSQLRANVIYSNSADYGGGAYVTHSIVTFTNNVLANNRASVSGDGLLVEGAVSLLLHNTIVDDEESNGVGVQVIEYVQYGPFGPRDYSSVALSNTVFANHSVGISVTSGNTATVNGVLWHNTPITISKGITAVVSVQNQHQGDPAFASDGYHLTASSMAIDKGIDVGITDDIDGEPRPVGAGCDLGADEMMWSTIVGPDTDGTLIYTDTQGSSTTVLIPAGAVTDEITLVYVPANVTTAPAGFSFAGHAFELDAYLGTHHLPDFRFNDAVTVTIQYTDADIVGLEEDSLVLDYWNQTTNAWVDASCGPYDRHPGENWLTIPICHLSRLALFGRSGTPVFLPLVVRNQQ